MNWHDNAAGQSIVLGFGILTVIATITVALRFWARRLIHLTMGLDDYLCALLLLLAYALLAVAVLAVSLGGLGVLPGAVSGEDVAKVNDNLFLCFFTFCFIYAASATLAKLTVLAFYHRVFPTVFMQRCGIVLGVASLLHGGILIIVTALQCEAWFVGDRRVHNGMDRSRNFGQSDNIAFFNAVMAFPNAIIDALVLCLPIRELMRLQTTRTRKAAICGVFMLGGISVIASASRIKANLVWYDRGSANAHQTLTGPWAAGLVEIGTAAIAACLPTLPPVWHFLRRNRLWSGSTSCQQAATQSTSSRRQGPGSTAWSVLTIGRIPNTESRKRAASTGSIFTGMELHRTEFCRIDSPEPRGPHPSPEFVGNDDDEGNDGLDAHGKGEEADMATRNIKEIS